MTISYRDLDGLRATLESTRTQRYPRVEHIVIDGGSGASVVEFLAEAGIAYWQSESDGGRYDAMNQGIGHASGDLIWFLHSSDRFADEDVVGRAVAALAHNDTDVRRTWGFGGATLVTDGGRTGRYWGYRRFHRRRFEFGVAPIPHQAAVFGAEIVSAVGGYSTTFGLAADHLFMLQAARRAEPVVIAGSLCLFDTSGAGSVRPQREHFRDIRAAWSVAESRSAASRRLFTAMSYIVEAEAAAKRHLRGVLGRAR
ncbi:glycosyltransferase [Williamsia deligens]|uniref:glycosyltransferase n=1 Tax=Williamsia deligens TaxID=321325 RepID=UPI0020A5F00B